MNVLLNKLKGRKWVFYTSQGRLWVTTVVKTNGNGEREYTSVNRITPRFSSLMKKVGIDAPKGTGFYALRRTAATMAARSGDPFAAQRLLGHVDLTMATRYVQDVSEQTDRVIENSRKYVLRGEDAACSVIPFENIAFGRFCTQAIKTVTI